MGGLLSQAQCSIWERGKVAMAPRELQEPRMYDGGWFLKENGLITEEVEWMGS